MTHLLLFFRPHLFVGDVRLAAQQNEAEGVHVFFLRGLTGVRGGLGPHVSDQRDDGFPEGHALQARVPPG